MMIRHITGAQHVIGQDQGYLGLPVLWQTIKMTLNDGATHDVVQMVTAWEPTPSELAMIQAGHSIRVGLIAAQHPPITLWVEGDESLDDHKRLGELAIEGVENLKKFWQAERQKHGNNALMQHMIEECNYILGRLERLPTR